MRCWRRSRAKEHVAGFVVQGSATAEGHRREERRPRALDRAASGFLQQLAPPLMRDLGGVADQASPVVRDLGLAAPATDRVVEELERLGLDPPSGSQPGRRPAAGRNPAVIDSRPLTEENLADFANDAVPVCGLQALTTSLDQTRG